MFPKNIEKANLRLVTRNIEGLKGRNMTIMEFRSKNTRKRVQKKYKARHYFSLTKDTPRNEYRLIVKAIDFNEVELTHKERASITNVFSYVEL